MKTSLQLSLCFLLTSALAVVAGEPDRTMTSQPALTLAGAHKVLAAATRYAEQHQAPGGSIAVVDTGGHLLCFQRLDGTFAASANVSIGKARTAALFRKATKAFEDTINQGRFTMTTLPEFTPLQGGIPILHDGQIIGAIGVSGAMSAQQDEEIALAGAGAIASKDVVGLDR